METNTHILFYGHGAHVQYNVFSNFYPCNFSDKDGQLYSCSEQYFMFKKALLFDNKNISLINKILSTNDPKKIKHYGRLVKNFNGNIWNEVKFQIMFEANYYKFTQNTDLKQILVSTNDKILVEASPMDAIWGAGKSARDIITNSYKFPGQNLLGKVLMIVRDKIINKA